jgi:hypothetical protein
MVLVLMFAVVCAARGLTRIEDLFPKVCTGVWNSFWSWRKKPARAVPGELLRWLVVGLSAFGAFTVARPQLEELLKSVRVEPGDIYVQEGPRTYDAPFRQHRGNRRDAHIFPTANMGTLYCVAGNPIPESPLLRGDLPAEEYPASPAQGTVKRLSWSPNAIELEVDAREPMNVRVNQNWAPAWRTNIGTVKSEQKLLTVDVPAGKHIVRLEYRDYGLIACLLVSLATLLALLVLLARDALNAIRRLVRHWAALPMWPDERPPALAPSVERADIEEP